MKTNFAFLKVSEVIEGVILLPAEAKEKKNPFIIVNTDNDRGLYVRKLEQEIAKYKGLVSADNDPKFTSIETKDLIIFGDSKNFDYRIEDMKYITLNSLMGRDVKVYDLVADYPKIVKRLVTYCKNNGIKRKAAYRDEDVTVRVNLVVEEPAWTTRIRTQANECLLLAAKRFVAAPVTKTLVNVYSKPDVSVEKITVHTNWVKIGYNQYDIFVDLFGGEFIVLEDGQKMFVKTDRFGHRYLTA